MGPAERLTTNDCRRFARGISFAGAGSVWLEHEKRNNTTVAVKTTGGQGAYGQTADTNGPFCEKASAVARANADF